ncbi:recombinase family protein, partial [Kitasatospora sp. NPDC001574]
AAEIIQNVAERILADETGKITCSTEAARLNRAKVPSPSDRRAQLYGRPLKGTLWTGKSIRGILTSEAALGLLLHQGHPVLGQDGRPVRLADPLWDRPTRDALIEKTNPKRTATDRAPMGIRRLAGISWCGNCGFRLYIAGRDAELAYGCTARVRGVAASQHCQPAPSMTISALDQIVEDWFLSRYGDGQVMRRMYDPGTGYATRIKELQADRKRLRNDRARGMYTDEDDSEWYEETYASLGAEIQELKAMPERPAGMRMMPTGRTVRQEWTAAPDDAARREMLNEFGVRVVLFPTEAPQRYAITATLNPYAQAA